MAFALFVAAPKAVFLLRHRRSCILAPMSIEQLKAEVMAASPEAREELFTLLSALRRSGDRARAKMLAEKLDDSSRWVSEEEAARRLGVNEEK